MKTTAEESRMVALAGIIAGDKSIIEAQRHSIEELQKIVTRLDGHEWEYKGQLKSGKRYYLADRYAVEQDHMYLVDPTEEELAEITA